MLIKTYDDNGR